MFIKLRDTFEGITDGDKYGTGVPIDNHPRSRKKSIANPPIIETRSRSGSAIS